MKVSNVQQLPSTQIVTAGLPVALTPPAIVGAPYYINIHSDTGSTDTVFISPAGASYYNFTFFNIAPVGGIAVRPGDDITLGPIFGEFDGLQINPETAGGGNCTLDVTYSQVRSFGPTLNRRTKSLSVVEGTFRCADNTNPTRIKPFKEQNYWDGDTPAYFNVFMRQNTAAPADYSIYVVPPDSTDTTSGFHVGLEEGITVGPFTKENAPDIYVPPVAGVQGICFSYSPVYDGANPQIKFDYEHNVVQNISNSGPATDIEIYLNCDDAPGSSVIHNFSTYVNPLPINAPTLQSEGIDGWGIELDGVNQGIGYPLGTFPYSQGQSNNYSISMWVRPQTYPGDAGYPGIDSTCYICCNTNVPFGGRQGFVVLLSSAISAYGVDGAVVYQPYHGSTPFGAGTGFRNTNPEFLLQRDTWNHVVINRDVVSGIEIWINGQLAVSDPFNQTSANPSNGDITIGNRGTSTFDGGSFYNRNTLDGSVDEFLLMNRTLTPTEITDLYNAGVRT